MHDERHPRLSIVLTTYNRGHVLAETLRDILEQTFVEFELFVRDDHSTDDTESVVKALTSGDPRVTYVRNQWNLGMPANLNAGIALCSGEYIANLHDGDRFAPDLLATWIQTLDECAQAGFVFNAYRQLDENGCVERVYRQPLQRCSPGSALLKRYFSRWHFDSPVFAMVMARRSAYEETGLLDPRFGMYADVDMWLRLAETHGVAYVPEPLMDLSSRKALPSHWTGSRRKGKVIARRIFWEARMRHYREQPIRRTLEAGRHVAFMIADDAYDFALSARRMLLMRRHGRSTPSSMGGQV
jgi:glycosyltransferase involved in cell wall biosynthesis